MCKWKFLLSIQAMYSNLVKKSSGLYIKTPKGMTHVYYRFGRQHSVGDTIVFDFAVQVTGLPEFKMRLS